MGSPATGGIAERISRLEKTWLVAREKRARSAYNDRIQLKRSFF
jgi:hypothetical protein